MFPPSTELLAAAKAAALAHGLDAALVCAVVEQESGWDTDSIRYEPAFFERYIKPITNLTQTEAQGRAFSWGLMQVMGQVARENGFGGLYFPSLCEPAIGLDVGCAVLAGKLKRANGDTSQGLLFWNGGGNSDYAAEVLARLDKYRSLIGA
jgi:soluble lytic murein transglycosylase-like protein